MGWFGALKWGLELRHMAFEDLNWLVSKAETLFYI